MHIQDELTAKVEQFMKTSREHMGDTLGIEFLSFRKDEVRASMPVNEKTVQPFGILHGGASVALAETLASIGAWLNVEDSKTAVGVEINANHLRPVREGLTVVGTAIPLKRGRNIHVWETKILSEQEKLVCVSKCTLMIVDTP